MMTLYYLANRPRPEIFTAIYYCATKTLAPNNEDEKKFDIILLYLLLLKDQEDDPQCRVRPRP